MKKARTWFKPLARAGYGGRGLVYLFAGIFAVIAGFSGSQEAGSREVIDWLLNQPFGRTILFALTVCLAGYVAWRLVQSLLDADEHGFDVKGLVIRAGLFVSAMTYTILAIYTLSRLGVFSSDSGGGGGGGVADYIAGFIGAHYVSLVLAICFAGVGVAHVYKAATRRYNDHIQAPSEAQWLVDGSAMAGLGARGLIFFVLAVMSFYRFLSADGGSGDPPGLKDALGFIEGLPAGSILMAVMGLGLVAFAVYSFVESRYRRIDVEQASLPG
ncbi:DUF1206 domain-containing protein [Tepidamorphus sp. 3E244]|uniref:DUF1206 domain-containing protein n=1 Tax=Tepidamorphus sp. 3E244 TaxID=3385498 RepID=UPI0038FC4A47